MRKEENSTRNWPADQVERWPTANLVPSARNARLHAPADVRLIAASIRRFGFTNAILVDETGTIIAGHARALAAHSLKLETVPVIVARGWTAEEKRAYLLADNQLAARGVWDMAMLADEMGQLAAAGFDTAVVGFEAEEIAKLLGQVRGPSLTDPDAVPEAPQKPVSRLGDIWLLGQHRIICGDSTNAADVRTAMGALRPVLMVTDPPYGVAYDPSWRGKADGRKAGRSTGKVLNDDRADWHQAWALFPGDVAYIWHAGLFGGIVADSLTTCDFELRSQIIWVKQHFALSRADYHWRHETCIYAVRKGASSHWASDRKQSTVWEFPNNAAIGNPEREKVWGHGTQKPVEAMRRPMEHNSTIGDVVYDPFTGSGTTIIAAEMTGRVCVGIELNPSYVDVVIRRWCEFTGKEAIQEETGKTVAAVARERASSSADRNVS